MARQAPASVSMPENISGSGAKNSFSAQFFRRRGREGRELRFAAEEDLRQSRIGDFHQRFRVAAQGARDSSTPERPLPASRAKRPNRCFLNRTCLHYEGRRARRKLADLSQRTMIEGHIETLTPDGIVHGWVRDTGSLVPCHIQVLQAGEVVAEALAAQFRPELLRTGHGHGHYGFRARLQKKPAAGTVHRGAAFAASWAHSADGAYWSPGLTRQHQSTWRHCWPTRRAGRSMTCLRHPAAWRPSKTAGAWARPASSTPPIVSCSIAGRARPSKLLHTRNLDHGRLGPQDLLLDLLGSRERAELGTALPSPFDAVFPFIFA